MHIKRYVVFSKRAVVDNLDDDNDDGRPEKLRY